jgi:hypothetical protein
MYGLKVRSEVRLPLPDINLEGAVPDVTIELADDVSPAPSGEPHTEAYCTEPCHAGAAYSRMWRQADGAWIWHDAVGMLHVSADAGCVRVYSADGCDTGALQMELLGPAAGYILHQLGYPCLHASAVATPEGVVAFIGWPGDGKSTMVAMHLAHGARLLGDDVLPLDVHEGAVFVRPGLPLVKLWPASVRGVLAIDRELPHVSAQHDKRLLVVNDAQPTDETALRLTAVYLLRRYDPAQSGSTAIGSPALPSRAALTALLTHTYRREYLQPLEVGRLLPVYARLAATVPLRMLQYPSGFEFQSAVCEHLRRAGEVRAT